MNQQHKWELSRAGLLNFWYYDDEIYDFADGSMLLRGSNGSGKSVTMQSLLPILLDGKKTPERLDPFRSKDRKMEDYLLGEKEIVDRDERTGYLFLEYKQKHTDQYITTGIGLQARRHKDMTFWGFVIADNRRIGKDVFLYETERQGGKLEKIPLSRAQLENRLGEGGHVVKGQGEYMKLVNKYIFGFETLEAYEDLIELLLQLRSPKLSKDFRPTVIYDILQASLPALTDEDLRHLSDTIEHMDQTKQQIEQLEREQEALDKVMQRYDAYNRYRIVMAATNYTEAEAKHRQALADLTDKREEKAALEADIETQMTEREKLTQQSDVLKKKENRLRQHKVWNLEEEKAAEEKRCAEIAADRKAKDATVTRKLKEEFRTKDRLQALEVKQAELEEKMEHQLIDLAADAQEASFAPHSQNEADLKRRQEEEFDFTVWKKEALHHLEQLDAISEDLRTFEQMKTQISDVEKVMADTQMQMDQKRHEQKDWEQIFEKDKQEKLTEIHLWAERHDFFGFSEVLLQGASRDLHQLYESKPYERVRTPFMEANQAYQMDVREKMATKRSEQQTWMEQRQEKEALLTEWKETRDPEPPNVRDETKAARKALKEAGTGYLPLYEAVDFQEQVEEATRLKIEAALLDSGLLNALIAGEDVNVTHDRIIRANPQMMAHTLADYMQPDIEGNAPISGATVDDVLRSILIDTEAGDGQGMAIQMDGTYQIGMLAGDAIPIEQIRFIGKSARERYRLEQIEQIEAEIVDIEAREQEIAQDLTALAADISRAQEAMSAFPEDHDLQVSFEEIKVIRFDLVQLEKQLVQQDEKRNALLGHFQELKRKLDITTREMNLEITYTAYREAKKIQERYVRELNELEKAHMAFSHQLDRQRETRERLEDLAWEVDDLKGELAELEAKMTRLEQNITEIDNQLQQHGMEDIRKQIQDVQEAIQETNEAMMRVQSELPIRHADHRDVLAAIQSAEQKQVFTALMIRAWETVFEAEVQYRFFELPELNLAEQAAWVLEKIEPEQKEIAKIEEQLTKVYYDYYADLMEYRMTDQRTVVPDLEVAEETWKEEQQIMLDNWRNKAARRLFLLDFQGKKRSPYAVREHVEHDRLRQQNFLNEQDRQLYEEILFDSVGKKLRSRIYRAQQWTKKINEVMINSDSTSGITFSLKWRPRTAETEAELDTKKLVDLLSRDARLLKEADLQEVMEHFRSKIDRAKEVIIESGEGNTLLQVLKEVLDYRHWFAFELSFERTNEPKRELTNSRFNQFSGGEKAMAMYIPLFTACYSRYLEADKTAPFIITLDEAFAGVDDENISVLFRVIDDLGFDYIINSQVLWGDYATVPHLAIYELIRPKNAPYVSVIPYVWDGKKRRRLDEQESSEKEEVLHQ